MKKIGIFYFSGTGNTEIVAEKVREEFAGLGRDVVLMRIEDVLKGNREVDPAEFELVGIGCPVIGYGVPKIVRDFVKRLPRQTGGRMQEGRKKTFLFRTAGGVAPINYNASKALIRSLSRRGYEVFHERVFSIGSNWIVRFDDSIVRQLHKATLRKVALMCGEVDKGEKRILKTGPGLRIRMELANKAFSGFLRLVGKDLVVDKSCSDCGLCIKNCPAGNIVRKNGRIRFRFACNSCLRCIYSCPRSAIRFRFLTFFPVPGGYNIQKTLAAGDAEHEQASGRIPPFFKGYISNDSI